MLAHAFFPFSFWKTMGFSIANTVEVLVAAAFLAPGGGRRPDLTNLRTLGRFFLFGVVLAPLASTLFVQLARIVFSQPASLLELSNWYIGDAIGIAIMTPFILAMDPREIAVLFSSVRRWETVAILGGLTLISICVFAQSGLPVVFLLFPALLLVIFRLRSAGSAIGVFLMVVPAFCADDDGVADSQHSALAVFSHCFAGDDLFCVGRAGGSRSIAAGVDCRLQGSRR
jgi:integral membrane sensor domain MASE1